MMGTDSEPAQVVPLHFTVLLGPLHYRVGGEGKPFGICCDC